MKPSRWLKIIDYLYPFVLEVCTIPYRRNHVKEEFFWILTQEPRSNHRTGNRCIFNIFYTALVPFKTKKMNTKNFKLLAVMVEVWKFFFSILDIYIYRFFKRLFYYIAIKSGLRKKNQRAIYVGITTTDLPYRWGAGTGCWAAQVRNRLQNRTIPTPRWVNYPCWSADLMKVFLGTAIVQAQIQALFWSEAG